MGITDTYSKRNNPQGGPFAYDLNEKIKVQITFIWKRFFKQLPEDFNKSIWKYIHNTICEEFGVKTLLADDLRKYTDYFRVEFYFEKLATLEQCLDIIELVFKSMLNIPAIYKKEFHFALSLPYSTDQAIKDLNTRFLENNIGYQFEQNKIIKVSNELLHKEVMVKTFHFITSETFKNVNDEFLSAHVHYTEKRNKECLVDCLKAFESTMKIICSENGWSYDQKDTAKILIDICFQNKLVPDYLQTQFSSLRSMLESGIPTVRNKLGGHGQGVKVIQVPDHYTSYMLYMTATVINFLLSCQSQIKPFQ